MPAKPIKSVQMYDRLLNPAEAELWLNVLLHGAGPPIEVRGRLMGPRCRFAGTVEVAYPLRPRSGPTGRDDLLGLRVLIPEPSYWDPESPFLYEGPLEAWQGDERVQQLALRHGFRVLHLSQRGLRCNNRLVELRGRSVKELAETQALAFRQSGGNLLLTPLCDETAGLWDLADHFGFLMLGVLDGRAGIWDEVQALGGHPSCLGWVMPQALFERGSFPAELPAPLRTGQFLGAQLSGASMPTLPPAVQFLICDEACQPEPEAMAYPRLLLRRNETAPEGAGASDVLGWIDA